MVELLYPAYQKLYSALCNLERFDKEANFFDNISSLDGFFSEYRNITFVLQAQLKHTEYYAAYERNRDRYLQDHWFVEKRNETTKQQSFQLVKELQLTVYLPHLEVGVLNKEFSVENDKPLELLLSELKGFLSSIGLTEVFFSVAFSFHEKDSDIDLLDKLVSGISSMLQFMDAMDHDVMEDGVLCNQLMEKIRGMKFLLFPRDFLLVNDYVYYPSKDAFDRGARLAAMPLTGDKCERFPLATLIHPTHLNYDSTPFNNFTLMHAVLCGIQSGNNKDIMPVIAVVYEDETYDMNIFHASIKTTMYRKINETANLIASQGVKEVFYMSLYSFISLKEGIPATSKERVVASEGDYLVCACINDRMEEKEYVFDGREMSKPGYIAYIMKHGVTNSLHASRMNLYPIWQAFNKKQESSIHKQCGV